MDKISVVYNCAVLLFLLHTVKPVQNGHSQNDLKLIFKTNCRLIKVKSIVDLPFNESQKYCRMERGAFCDTV